MKREKNSYFYAELKNAIGQINAKSIDEEVTELIIDAYDRILFYSNIGNKEGLLLLNEVAYPPLPDEGSYGFLKYLLTLICDGREPGQVEDMGFIRYLADSYSASEALVCLMYLRGVLLIQGGERAETVAEYMKAFMPLEIRKKLYEREQSERPSSEEELQERIGELCYEDSCIDYHSFPKLDWLSTLIIHFDDNDMRKLTEEPLVPLRDWVIVMKVLPGEAKRRIFDCCLTRMADMIVHMIEYEPIIKTSDIEKAAGELLRWTAELMEDQMISDDMLKETWAYVE